MRYFCPKCEHGLALSQSVTRVGYREVNDRLEPQDAGEMFDEWRHAEVAEPEVYYCGECGCEYKRAELMHVEPRAAYLLAQNAALEETCARLRHMNMRLEAQLRAEAD